MPILQGFPPSNTIGPIIAFTEVDNTLLTPTPSTHQAGLIGFASKGPINTPTLITNLTDLYTTFGYPHPDVSDPYLIYAAEQYLQVGTDLYVVRVASNDAVDNESATVASVDVPASGGQVKITSATPGPYSFDVDSFFRWRLNGVLASKTLLVLSDDNRPAPHTGVPYATVDLVSDLNSQLTTDDGILFYATNDLEIAVETTYAYGPNASLELVSVQDAIYGNTLLNGNPTGLGSGMTTAKVTGTVGAYPNNGYSTPGTYDLSGLTGLNLLIVIDGTDNITIDQTVQTVDLSALTGTVTITDIVNEINALITGGSVPGGFVASAYGDSLVLQTLATGEDSKLLVKATSTAAALLGLPTITAVGTSPSGVTGDAAITTYGIVTGSSNNSSTITFTVTADSAGIDGDNTQIVVTNNTANSTFAISVFNNGNQMEAWGNLTKDSSSNLYVASFIATVSNWIRVVDNVSVAASPANGTYTLTGGNNGVPSTGDDQDTLLVGDPVALTGIYTLSDPEQIDIDLVAVPGHCSTRVVEGLIDLCSNPSFRRDCMAIIDAPFGLSVNDVVSWQNGTHPLNDVKLDTDYAALYWPWLQIYDNHNGVNVWVPACGSVMATIAQSDNLAAPWFPPAGVNRGIIPNDVLDVFSRPSASDRNLMQGNANAVNPIVQFSDVDGFVIWGQKTLQRTPTALDRISVRRMLFYVEKQIRAQCKPLLFEPNDAIFQNNFINIATKILDGVMAGRGLNAYKIIADSSINTNDTIARNEFYARIGIQPLYDVEFLFVEFSLHRLGSFTQNTDTF